MILDLIGLGIGPFNLSLAALLEKASIKNIFLDRKSKFTWHPELMFSDSIMQTSFLTDLVTPVDPTNPYSFLNYLVQKNLFYHFLNTERTFISRMEFEQYCQWVADKLSHKLTFNADVQEVTFANGIFTVSTNNKKYLTKNICVATGLIPRIPKCAEKFIGPDLFYAKSSQLTQMKLTGKTVTIIGGGQTGVEIFGNILRNKWGHAKAIRLVTARNNLESYDTSPFTSEYFTPNYVDSFWNFHPDQKSKIVTHQNLLSDGNTPGYLTQLYNDLYQKKHVEHDPREMTILACRKLTGVEKTLEGFRLILNNAIHDCEEYIDSDVVILCTGLQSVIPSFLEPLFPLIHFDAQGRFNFNKSYAVNWDGSDNNRIYALNFSRHQHGIVDPQTNLMAWRSAVVVNDLLNKELYRTSPEVKNFVEYEKYKDYEMFYSSNQYV